MAKVIKHIQQQIVVGCAMLLAIGSGWSGDGMAAVYRCVDGTGASVFTDTPTQLEQCAPLQAGPGSTTIRSVESGQSAMIMPPVPDPSMVAPAVPIPGSPVIDSAPSVPAPAASPPLGTSSTDVVRCTPGLNPLNPLTVVCGPSP